MNRDEAKKKISKNGDFQLLQFLIFFSKISGIGPWFSKIDWCEGHWYGSTYMAERQKHIFCIFRLFLSLRTTGSWAYKLSHTMPFESINPTNPRTNPWNFRKQFLRIDGFENLSFFKSAAQSAIWNIFLKIFFCFIFVKICQHL